MVVGICILEITIVGKQGVFMGRNKRNSKKIIIKKQIVFSKQFNTFASVFFIGLICLDFFGLLYLTDTAASIKNDILNLNKRIEKVENDNSCFKNIDEEINNYYRELSDKTDETIDRILTIVGLLATVITFFGILLTFRAPKDLEKKIDENKALLVRAEKASEEAKYQTRIIAALNVDYNGKMTNYEKIQRISEIIKKYPDKAAAYMHRAALYKNMANQLSDFKKKEFLHLAISDYEIAHKLGVDESAYYNDRGIAHSILHEYHKAIKYYTKAIKNDPENIIAYANRGNDYYNIGEYQKSLDDFEKALEIDLDYYNVYLFRSFTYQCLWRKQKNPKQRDNYIQLQIDDLAHAIELDPEDNTAKQFLRELIDDLSKMQLLNRFGLDGNPEDAITRVSAKFIEIRGDLQKKQKAYVEALEQYIEAFLLYGNLYIVHEDVNVKSDIIRIISKIYDVYSNNVQSQIDAMDITINKFLNIMRILSIRLYEDGEKEAVEKLLILLEIYGDDSALNLAFMKRRCETKYIEKSTKELLDLCVDQKSAVWCMNKALCYVDGIDVDVNWHKAIEILDNSETDINGAVDWWSQVNVVGEKENNIAFLLFALSKKHYVTDLLSLEERINRAKKDGYDIPDDL